MRTATRTLILRTLVQPHSRRELSVALGVDIRTVQSHLTAIREEKPRPVSIVRWKRNSPGSPTPIYAISDLPDAPRPMRFSSAKTTARSRCDPETRWEEAKRRKAARIVPFRDPFTTAFFGPATK